ncbi:MAG: His/Gly/Thr/Pro-type tRNA ligase C-terminal domain-containing protein, partial [Gemmatimonadales bacterium]
PLLINQWANVVRWEMRTRLFLRTLEFLWQEGHTAHATEAEAEEETRRMLGVYRDFMEGWMAMPVVTGRKSESEKFAGALRTYSCEAMMQDNKALQAGTSHNLGQNFARAFDLTFQTEAGELDFAWNTSWGVSTRMVGGLVMTHGDDSGLVTPPLLAPIEVVIVPIYRTDEDRARVLEAAMRIKESLGSWERRSPARLRIHVDAREGIKPGAKYYEWELRGIPLRMEIGPRDLDSGQAVLVRRDTREKRAFPLDTIGESINDMLSAIQENLLETARKRRENNSVRGNITYDRFREIMDGDGAFVYAGWCGSAECEAKIKDETKATIRVLPDEEFCSAEAPTTCLMCGEPAVAEALWAKAY